MTTLDLGPVGAVLTPDADQLADAAVAVESAGYPTIWLTGGPLKGLDQVVDVVRATRTARVGVAILSVDRFGADEVGALYRELEAEHPGRFVVGLGGAHGARPIDTLRGYLDGLTAVPVGRRVLAALGPRMLDLAREKAAAVLPVLVTPEWTAATRQALGPDTALAVMQLAALDADPERARATARGPLGFLGSVPAYQANFRRMGFTDEEIQARADRLVDALVPWGTADDLAAVVRAQHSSGADHVAVSLTAATPATIPVRGFEQLATALGLGG